MKKLLSIFLLLFVLSFIIWGGNIFYCKKYGIKQNNFRIKKHIPLVGNEWSVSNKTWFFNCKNHRWVNKVNTKYPKHVYKAINFWNSKLDNEIDYFYFDANGFVLVEAMYSYSKDASGTYPYEYLYIERDSSLYLKRKHYLEKNQYDSLLLSWGINSSLNK